jgi:hypothetical protein
MKHTIQQEQLVVPQVWFELGKEAQAGVIQLMAQLVLKVIMAQIESSRKEGRDGQNPG